MPASLATTDSAASTSTARAKSADKAVEYETRFLESLKQLNAPKWFVDQQDRSTSSEYSTKNRYDRLKQRFRPSRSSFQDENTTQDRVRHKSATSTRSLIVPNTTVNLVDIDLDAEYDESEPTESPLKRNVTCSKSAHSLHMPRYTNNSPSSNLILNQYVNKSYSNYINEMTSRHSQGCNSGHEMDQGVMKRSKSSYNTYSSQIINKYRRSNDSSKSTSNLKHSSTSLSIPSTRSQSQWYKPKPLQLPPDFEKKLTNETGDAIKQIIAEDSKKSIVVRDIMNDDQEAHTKTKDMKIEPIKNRIHISNQQINPSDANDNKTTQAPEPTTTGIIMNTGQQQQSLDCDDDTSAGLESFGRQLIESSPSNAHQVPSIVNSLCTADISEKAFSSVVDSLDELTDEIKPKLPVVKDSVQMESMDGVVIECKVDVKPSDFEAIDGQGFETKKAEESYDNLNESTPIEASYIIEDEEEDYDNAMPKIDAAVVNDISEPINSQQQMDEHQQKSESDNLLNDFMNRSNTTPFIFSNGRYFSGNGNATGNNKTNNGGTNSASGSLTSFANDQNQLSSNSFNNSNCENQFSEEIEDDDDDFMAVKKGMAQDELRTFDDIGNEDEFFLISTPATFDRNSFLNSHGQAQADNELDNENDDEDEDDEDEDEVEEFNTHVQHKPINTLRYQVQYELNRLSNIIEEEDFNYEEEDQRNASGEHVVEEFSKQESLGAIGDDDNEEDDDNFLNKKSVDNFKAMLELGEKISSSYSKIQTELAKPVTYRPVMKKRVYQLNRAYIDTPKPDLAKEDTEPAKDEEPVEIVSQKITENKTVTEEITTTTTTTISTISNKVEPMDVSVDSLQPQQAEPMSEKSEPTEPDNKKKQKTEAGPNDYSMLNYLIGRLNEQHKKKLKAPELSKSNTNQAEVDSTKEQINNDFETFEKQLFEKYKIAPSVDSLNEPESIDSLNKVACDVDPARDGSYVLTRSLYAEHKQLKVDCAVSQQEDSLEAAVSPGRGAITALSINEIETRKSLVMPTNNEQADTSDDGDHSESQDEKSVKEEFVLIGEKNDIDSLLDNRNNQLYNLIMSNSTRTNKLDEIETNLNKERIEKLKQPSPTPVATERFVQIDPEQKKNTDFDVEIEVESELNQPDEYESGLRDIAKYLVDEITEISINKVKIDALNETLDGKYFTQDLLAKHEILSTLISSNEAATQQIVEKQEELGGQIKNKNREQLFDYYTNLEKNLECVRAEIDKLKQEAYDDLAYINEILVSESEMSQGAEKPAIVVDDEEIKLNDEFETQVKLLNEKNQELERSLNFKSTKSPNNLTSESLPGATESEMEGNRTQDTVIEVKVTAPAEIEKFVDDEDEEETQYLSQKSNDPEASHSQIYITPAESWQTLKNGDFDSQDNSGSCPVIDFKNGPIFDSLDMNDADDGGDSENHTDLDGDIEDDANEDETSITLTLEAINGADHSTPLKNNLSMKSFEIKQIPPFRGSSFNGNQSFDKPSAPTPTKAPTTKPLEEDEEEEADTKQEQYDSSFDMASDEMLELPNMNHSQNISNLVKSCLARPSVPAPPVPQSRSSVLSTASSTTTATTTTETSYLPRTSTSANGETSSTNTSNTNKQLDRSEPVVKPRVSVLEKKSLDKFLKMASCNSASLLDLNQQKSHDSKSVAQSHVPVLSKSAIQVHKESENNSTSRASQLESENQRLLTTREERSLSTSNNHHIQQQQSQHQMKQSNPMPRSATSNFNKQNQNNTNLMPASRSCHGLSMTESSRNSSTQALPSTSPSSNRNSSKATTATESAIEAVLAAANKDANSQQFRIPSSRHFCGRLLSHKLHSATSSASSNYDNSDTNSSESSEEVSNPKHDHNSGSEEFDQESGDFDSNNSDYETNQGAAAAAQQVPVISSSSISTTSSQSQKIVSSSTRPLASRHINLISVSSKPMPTQRRSVSNQQRSDLMDALPTHTAANGTGFSAKGHMSARNTVRFSESNQENLSMAKSQHNISYTPMEKSADNISFSDENLDREPSQNVLNRQHTRPTEPTSPYKNISLAKSVDHLLASFNHTQNSSSAALSIANNNGNAIQRSQKDLRRNQVQGGNKPVNDNTLSKSIKDLKLFVSNSFSPSQIVKPPQKEEKQQQQQQPQTPKPNHYVNEGVQYSERNYENNIKFQPNVNNYQNNMQRASHTNSSQQRQNNQYVNQRVVGAQQNQQRHSNYQNNNGNQFNEYQNLAQQQLQQREVYPVIELEATKVPQVFKTRMAMHENKNHQVPQKMRQIGGQEVQRQSQQQQQQQKPMARRTNQHYNNGDNYDNLKAIQLQQQRAIQIQQQRQLPQQHQPKSRVPSGRSDLPTHNQVFPRQRSANGNQAHVRPDYQQFNNSRHMNNHNNNNFYPPPSHRFINSNPAAPALSHRVTKETNL